MSTIIGQISQCSTGDDMREDWIKNIYDTDDWVRGSRGGHSLQFFATDDELQSWFLVIYQRRKAKC